MNAVIYARYSSASQTEQSIEGQLRDCYAFAEREGLLVVGEYIDRAISGRSDDRPDFLQMINDAAKKQFERIIVWKLDRFARNRYDSAFYKHKLKQYGVKVLSAMECIGDGDESIILEAVLEASAEYYSRDLSKKVRRGMRESATKGMSTGAPPGLGYRWVDKKPTVVESEADIVRYVFEQYGAGVPSKDIIAAVNKKGMKNKRGNAVTQSTFRKVLQNRKYIGEASWNGISMEWPAIISPELFERVQGKIAVKRRAPAAAKAKVEYMLSGKAFCGYCGSGMVGDSGTGKYGTYYYYSCGKRKKLATACAKAREKKDFIEWYIVEQTVLYVLDAQRREHIAERVVEEYDKEFNNGRLEALEWRASKLGRDIEKCVDMMISTNSKTVQKSTELRIDAMAAEKEDLGIDISKLRIANKIRYTKDDILLWLEQFCKGDPMDPDFQRRIINVFVNCVYLYDDKIVVYYNIKGGRQVSFIGNCEALDNDSESHYNNSSRGVGITSPMAHQSSFCPSLLWGAKHYQNGK
ncbi:MAG: recombinase family protein [Angelakisella sp.]